MDKNKQTDPQLENINKLLDVFIDKFSIALSEKSDDKRRQIAFELLSCVCAFNVSPFYAKDNCWTATKIGNEYKTDGEDGKIDGYYIRANKDQITIKVMQSKFTDSVSQNDVELFFASVKKYLIKQPKQLPPGYKALKSIIDAINEKKNNTLTLYQNLNYIYVQEQAPTIKKLFEIVSTTNPLILMLNLNL